jgi:hypothetical protein
LRFFLTVKPRRDSALRRGSFYRQETHARETVIIAAACFLIVIMAAALIVHFVVP